MNRCGWCGKEEATERRCATWTCATCAVNKAARVTAYLKLLARVMAKMVPYVLAVALIGCVDPAPMPTCASLGCPSAPSGTDDIWTPCTDDVCWCRTTIDVEECSTEGEHGDHPH